MLLSYSDPSLYEMFFMMIGSDPKSYYHAHHDPIWQTARVQFSLEKCNMGVSSPPTWEKNGSIQMGLPKKGFYDVSDWKYK